MRKILSLLIVCLIFNVVGLKAADILPSDNYYKENIVVNNINADAPSTRADDDFPPNPGGDDDGDVDWHGGTDSPVGDAILPISLVAISYGAFILLKNRKKKIAE